jgi:hypothetical protein
MIMRNEAGLVISGDELLTDNGRLILDLHSELCEMRRDRDWWRKAALGKHWEDALNEDDF